MGAKSQVRTKTKTCTISELVGLYGVTIGSISVLIKKRDSESVKTGQNNAEYYDADVLEQLRLHYVKSKPKHDKADNTQGLKARLAVAQSENQLLHGRLESAKSTVEILRNELKTKNLQIDKL